MNRTSAPTGASLPRYFFIHVMKTGGTALFTNVAKNFAVDEVYPHPELDIRDFSPNNVPFRAIRIDYLRSLPADRQGRIRLYSGHFPFVTCEMLGGGFLTMTILRHPVDRTISLLRQLQRDETATSQDDGRGVTPELEEMYERPQVFEPLVHNHQAKIFSMTIADDPKGYMQTISVDDARLARARQNLASVDVVGLTERHADFVDAVAARFGWRLKREVRGNSAPEKSPEVSSSFRHRIAADNAIDIEFYEYATQLVTSRRN